MIALRAWLAVGVAIAGLPGLSAAEPRVTVADLAWLAGDWEGAAPGGATIVAHYSDATGGVIVSASREIKNGRVVAYDMEHIAEKEGVVIYTPHPGGKKSDAFPVASYDVAGRSIVFENVQHDFPKRFTFALVAPDNLIITLSGPGKEGKDRALVYDLRRKRG